MNKRLFLSTLLIALFAFSRVAYPWGATGGDGERAQTLQETAVFFNNSGQTMEEGMIAILDKTGTGVTSGSTLGSYVTLTTEAQISGIVGVVKTSSATNQSAVVIITKGPADTLVQDSTYPVNVSNYVTTVPSVAGRGGVNESDNPAATQGFLGQALESGDGTDGERIWVWVNPLP